VQRFQPVCLQAGGAGACAGCCSVLLIKSTEFIIRCWTFNVRCSTFISFFLDQTGRFSGQRRRSYETTPKCRVSCKLVYKIWRDGALSKVMMIIISLRLKAIRCCSAILLGFADSKKWLDSRLGRGTKPNNRYRYVQPNLRMTQWSMLESSPRMGCLC